MSSKRLQATYKELGGMLRRSLGSNVICLTLLRNKKFSENYHITHPPTPPTIMTSNAARAKALDSLGWLEAKTKYDGNCILHLVEKFQASSMVSGVVLQMQRDLQWFKAVEKVVVDACPSLLDHRNKVNLTPREVFTKEHMQLVKDGEKWMKGAAESHTVVGALVSMVVFAAIFTVPGAATPKVCPISCTIHRFITFIVANVVTLFFSCISVLTCLGILSTRYSEDDFLKSLLRKLIFGIITLYIAIGNMMVKFCAALWILLTLQNDRILLLISTSIGLTILHFVSFQFPLLFEILVSTYFHKFSH